MTLLEKYRKVRKASEAICMPLQIEDYVVQPVVDVSPPKWHLGHTTWFWEAFVLLPNLPGYAPCNPDYNFVFNSYYETIGARVVRTDRGNLSRPSVSSVYEYRKYVDAAMEEFIIGGPGETLEKLIILGLNHEQQHQELLWSDIKYILGNNPLFPAWSDHDIDDLATPVQPGAAARGINGGVAAGGRESTGGNVSYSGGGDKAGPGEGGGDKAGGHGVGDAFLSVPAGVYEIGYQGDGFCFDNELSRHKVYCNEFQIAAELVTNEEYIDFINAGGYGNFVYWHAEGWDWVKKNSVEAPMYWHYIDGEWYTYTLAGLRAVDPKQPVCHISYYEAVAYAAWKGYRLPTEWEWEAASGEFEWGKRWEWTESAYLPYPGFVKAAGAIGEYNGKFMVSQMVLRGASVATPGEHSRNTYRNFFHPDLRWQFTGIRLAK